MQEAIYRVLATTALAWSVTPVAQTRTGRMQLSPLRAIGARPPDGPVPAHAAAGSRARAQRPHQRDRVNAVGRALLALDRNATNATSDEALRTLPGATIRATSD